MEDSAQHDWWVIASGACALHGVDPGVVRDLDVLIDRRDAVPVLAEAGLEAAPGKADPLFRSEVFATWNGTVLPVEFMAGFYLREAAVWTEIWPITKVWMPLGGVRLPVPDRTELRDLLLRFGREKDLVRAALL